MIKQKKFTASYDGKVDHIIMEHQGKSFFKIVFINGENYNQNIFSINYECAIRSFYFCEKGRIVPCISRSA